MKLHILALGQPSAGELVGELAQLSEAAGWDMTSTKSEDFDPLKTQVAPNTKVMVHLGRPARLDTITTLRSVANTGMLFQVVVDQALAEDPVLRFNAMAAGAQMISGNLDSLPEALRLIEEMLAGDKSVQYSCPSCGEVLRGENQLRDHYSIYHSGDAMKAGTCELCKKNVRGPRGFAAHFHHFHGPLSERPPEKPDFAGFAWIVVHDPSTNKYLLTNEKAVAAGGKPRYWLPAGRVDPGETFSQAAVRETLEEGGVAIVLQGVLKFMLDVCPRVVFLAHPSKEGTPAKTIPDYDSVGAMWVDLEQLSKLGRPHYRGNDPDYLFPAHSNGQLKVQSMDTAAFKNIEALMSDLTKKPRASVNDELAFGKAWNKLHKKYPKENFDEVHRDKHAYGPSKW